MSKFKVGDIIVGKDGNPGKYNLTSCERGFKGIIVEVFEKDIWGDDIRVEITESMLSKEIGSRVPVESDNFLLADRLISTPIQPNIVIEKPYIYAISKGKVGISKCKVADDFDEEFGKKLAIARLNEDAEEEARLIEEKFPHTPILFDSNGLELVHGDKVILLHEGKESIGERLVVFEVSEHSNRADLFIRGIRDSCDDKTGKIDDRWTVYKLATK